jgi:ABC-type transport system involved in cytochrome c biogenesis ATPase subunit
MHERYDKEEDRANDIKRHDNPHHMGHFGNLKRLFSAIENLKEYEQTQFKPRGQSNERSGQSTSG